MEKHSEKDCLIVMSYGMILTRPVGVKLLTFHGKCFYWPLRIEDSTEPPLRLMIITSNGL
jgi:hypothetical protein